MSHAVHLRVPSLPPIPDFGKPLPRWTWTLVGTLAIPLWATWPLLAVTAGGIPVFQLLTIAFAVGWFVLPRFDRAEAAGAESWRRRLVGAASCAFGLLGANAFFVFSTAYIPPAQANLISFLWPVMIMAMGALLGFFALRWRHFVGIGAGFAGAAVVIGAEDVVFSWLGVSLAAMSGVSWALFCLFRLRQGALARSVLGDGCALSALVSLALHLGFERTVVPDGTSLAAAVAIGIAPLALANLAWDKGIRRGDSRTLAVMAYGTPLAASLILIAFGRAMPSVGLFLGGALIVAAGLLSAAKRSGGQE